MQIPLVGQKDDPQGKGGGTAGQNAWYVESAFGSSIRDSAEAEQDHLSRLLHFSHRRVLIIGEPLARSGVVPMFDSIFRIPQNRLSALPVVAIGNARDVLVADAPIEKTPAEMIRELSQMGMREPINLRIFLYSLLTEGIDPVAPAIRKVPTTTKLKKEQQTTIQLAGIAVFRHDKLAVVLEDRVATGLLLAMGRAQNPTIDVTLPGEKRSRTAILQVMSSTSNIRPKLRNGRIEVNIALDVTANLAENMSDFDPTDYRRRSDMERAAERRVGQLVEQAVSALQRHNADALGVGDAVHRRYRNHWRRVRGRWEEEHYPNVKITIEPQVHIEHDGALIRSLNRKLKESNPS